MPLSGFSYFFLSFFFLTSSLYAGSLFEKYPALMDTLMGGYYAEAHKIADEISADFPNHPVGLYAKATVLYAHCFDIEDSIGRSAFMELTDQCAERADSMLETADNLKDQAELYFLAGSAIAAKGLLYEHEGKRITAIRLLMDSRGKFDRAIELDSTFYEAYLGRGAYRYAASVNAGILRFLPFIPSLESGWKDLWLAVERSRFSKYSAFSAMVWLIIQQENFVLADSICNAGLSRFPDSRTFLWPKLSLSTKQKDWQGAKAICLNLLNQYLKLAENNGYETLNLYCNLMYLSDELGKPDEAVRYAEEGLKTFRTDESAKRRKEKIRAMEERTR